MVYVQALVLNILAVCVAMAQTSTYVPPAPVQPLPFSHKQHVANGLVLQGLPRHAGAWRPRNFSGHRQVHGLYITIKKESVGFRNWPSTTRTTRKFP